MKNKKSKILIFTILFVLFVNQNNILSNLQPSQNLQEPKSATYTFDLDTFDLTHTRGNSYIDFTLNFSLADINPDFEGQIITGIYLELDDYGNDGGVGYCRQVIDGEYGILPGANNDTELYGYSTEETIVNESIGQILHGITEQYLIPTSDFYNDGGDDGEGYNTYHINLTDPADPLISSTSYTDSRIDLTYEFYPIFNLITMDSIFDSTNTYISIFDEFTDEWTDFNIYEEVVIYHPEYKLRVYEKSTDILLFEDTTNQWFAYYKNINIDCIRLTNNADQPVVFKLTGTNPLNQQINPFDSLVIFCDDYTGYTVEDLYNNVVDTGGSVDSEDELIYTPSYEDSVYLKYIDQNELTLDFNDFRTEIDFGDGYIPVLNQIFNAERNSTINVSVYNLDSNLLTNDSLFISPGLNYKSITIPVIYIENNADEQITAYLFNESSEPTDFYTYSYLDSDYESYENSSYIENFDTNSFQDTNISFVNNSNNCPSLSLSYENQVNIGENNTFNIYPIKTVNDISIVKIWNNITLVNETLTESLGYYTKNFNSSYSHYYSVEIYIEDISGYYNIMKIDNIFVFKNQIRINLENLQNKYIQYTSLNISANLYKFDGSQFSGSVNFTLKYPNSTIILEDETPNLEYNFGYTCDYYTIIAEYFGDLDNLGSSVETIFEVITPPGQSYQIIYFDEDPIFNITISPYSTEFHNMTSFTDETLYIMYFDIYNNELDSDVFNFSTTNNLVYTPEMLKQCRIIFTNQFNNLLPFENYHVYIDGISMLSNIFYRTVDSTLNITVYDLFGNLLYEDNYIVEREDNFIDLTLEQFSLKILNQLQDSTILNITNEINPLDFVLSEYIAIEELISLYVKEGNYSIYYLDDSGIEHTLSLNINQSRLVILNTTYREVHFAFFDLSGLGLDPDTGRFYINNERRDIGKNWVQGNICNLKVLDYFNETLYNGDISLVSLTEFNIYIPVFTMLINNNFSTSMEISFKRIGNSIEFKQIIPAQSGFDIRLLANVQYGIHIYYTNGTLADSKTVLLDENYKQISFGFYSEPISISPEDIQLKYQDFLLWGLFSIVFLTVISVLFIKSKRDLEKTQPKKSKSKKRGIRNDNKTTMGGF